MEVQPIKPVCDFVYDKKAKKLVLTCQPIYPATPIDMMNGDTFQRQTHNANPGFKRKPQPIVICVGKDGSKLV